MKKNARTLLPALAVLTLSGCASTKGLKVLEETEDVLVFRNYQDEIITHEIKKDVEKCQYDKSLFKIGRNGASYKGDSAYTVKKGIDVSHHDGKIDWQKVKKSGIEFAVIRVGYRGYQSGLLNPDRNFHENMKEAQAAGLETGVYIFSQAITEEEALEEADFVLKEIEGYNLALPVVFDPESIPWEEARTDSISGEQFTKNTAAFCRKIQAAGYEPMVYSNITWETKYLDLSQLKDWKIWFADYQIPISPYHFEFWQYCGIGLKVPGIKKKVDGDLMFIKTE